jgi:hypothetical protein
MRSPIRNRSAQQGVPAMFLRGKAYPSPMTKHDRGNSM